MHLTTLPRVRLEGTASRDVQEARRRLVAEAARAEMDANPQHAIRVFQHVDVMVTAADRAELLPRKGEQLALSGHGGVRDRVEHGVVANGGFVLSSHAE